MAVPLTVTPDPQHVSSLPSVNTSNVRTYFSLICSKTESNRVLVTPGKPAVRNSLIVCSNTNKNSLMSMLISHISSECSRTEHKGLFATPP